MDRDEMSEETRKLYDTLMEKEGFPELLKAFEEAKNWKERDKIFECICEESPKGRIYITSSYASIDGFKKDIIAYTEYKEISNGNEKTQHTAVCIYTEKG